MRIEVAKLLGDAGHPVLDVPWRRDVERSGAYVAAVFEGVGGGTGDEDERACGRFDHVVFEAEVQGSLEHEEHVVRRVMRCAGALGVRFEPPLGDGIPTVRLVTVGLEDGAESTHRVCPAFARAEHDRFTFSRVAHAGVPVCARTRASPFGPGVMCRSWPGALMVTLCHTPWGTTRASPAAMLTWRSPSGSSSRTDMAPEIR